jgi:hypothetical protein
VDLAQGSASSVADSHARKDVPNAVEKVCVAMQYCYSQSSILPVLGSQPYDKLISTYRNFYMPQEIFCLTKLGARIA